MDSLRNQWLEEEARWTWHHPDQSPHPPTAPALLRLTFSTIRCISSCRGVRRLRKSCSSR